GRAAAWPHLVEAARVDDPADVRAELADIVSELYSTISSVWPLLAVIEKSARDLPELEAMYFGRRRRGRRTMLERYVASRIERGHFRATVDAMVAARWLLESVTWFAWHRREDRDAELYDDGRVVAGLTTLIADALVEPAQ